MSRRAPAVQFYAEDFLGGTKFMSNAEVGLYIRLLCEQIDKGEVADDVEQFVKAYGTECRKLWPAVRSKFIEGNNPGMMVNERMAEAIEAREAFRARQSQRGKASAELRLASTTVQPRFNHGSTKALVEPLGDGDIIDSSGKERARDPILDAFWKAYPEKKGKGAALKAWAKMTSAERSACLPAITAQIAANHFRGVDGKDYIPHPATWLNQRRWEDEVRTTDQPRPKAIGWLTPARS